MPEQQSQHFYTIGQRIQALTLQAHGVTYAIIEEMVGVKKEALKKMRQRLIKNHGYDPLISRRIEVEMVQDAPRSGRPPTATTSEVSAAVLEVVQSTAAGREMSSDELGYLHGISGVSAWRILNASGLRKVKPSRKPGLTKAMRDARYQFALAHQDWIIDDWKKVVWSDETSVVLGKR